MNDVILVGGGLAGLAAATWCARSGARVTVLERAHAIGGRARTERIFGHAFNQGAHALFTAGAARRGLRELGIDPAAAAPPTRGLIAIAGGVRHTLPSGLASILSTDLVGIGAKIEAARALVAVTRADAKALRGVTWAEWASTVTRTPEVRALLDAFARVSTYANAPDVMSAGATIAQIKLAADHGVLYVHGGWQGIVDALEQAAVAAGVRIVAQAPAASVTRDGDGAVVTLADGARFPARSVILAVGPRTAGALLGDDALGAGLVPARAAALDVGLSELSRPQRLFALGLDQPTYFSVHSATARLCESGATIQLMKYLAPDAPADARADERELEGVLDLMQPGWRDRLVARRFLPGLVATNAIVLASGARPAVDAATARVPGVFLAGDWVESDAMLADAAVATARLAARCAIDHAARSAAPAPRGGAILRAS